MVPVEILKDLDVFDGLTPIELEAITEISEVATFPKGSVIFKENEEAERLFILLEGKVGIEFEVGRHQDAVVHSVNPGQAFGWSALIHPYQFSAWARAAEDSKVVTVERARLRKLLDMDCHMGFVIMEKMAELISARLRETRIQLISVLHG